MLMMVVELDRKCNSFRWTNIFFKGVHHDADCRTCFITVIRASPTSPSAVLHRGGVPPEATVGALATSSQTPRGDSRREGRAQAAQQMSAFLQFSVVNESSIHRLGAKGVFLQTFPPACNPVLRRWVTGLGATTFERRVSLRSVLALSGSLALPGVDLAP